MGEEGLRNNISKEELQENLQKEALKELLRAIKANNYEVPEKVRAFDLALEMTKYMGDLDPELRDRLIYVILSNWITNNVLSLEETHKILDICVDEQHLLYGLENADDSDSVFMRTFSALIVAAAVYRHRQSPFLSKQELSGILDRVLKFFNEDRDVRSFVQGKGWADGVSHGADALDELARCEELGHEDLSRILKAIHNKVNINYYGYFHEEDERMVTPVMAVFERKLISEEDIVQWLQDFKKIKKIGQYPEDLTLRINVKTFLRSLHFRLESSSDYSEIKIALKEILEVVSPYK